MSNSQSTESSAMLGDASKTLAWNLLSDKLKTNKASENYVVSPYSLTTAFAMAMFGARGATHDEMLASLGLPKQQQNADLIETFRAATKSVESSTAGGENEKLQLLTASKLYVQKDFGVNQEYLKKVQSAFSSTLEQVDFKSSPEKVRQQINAFVEQVTKDKIKDLLPEGILNELVRLVLISAVYMKAEWQEKFEKDATNENGEFYVAHEKRMQQNVPMMNLKKSFQYAENDVAQFVWLPYRGRQVQMVIAVPKSRDDGLKSLQSAVQSAGGFSAMLKSLKIEDDVDVQLTLPRFKIESTIDLNDIMKRLGMKLAFEERQADFGDMVKDPKNDKLFISKAIQKVMIKVDEAGTEAAAATAVIMMARCAMIRMDPKRVVEVKADKPFVYWVDHKPTGLVLFSGAVISPK